MQDILKIVDNLKDTGVRKLNDHILIVDGLNTLLRAFSVAPLVNSNGHNVGGILGFLKSLGSLNRQFSPTRIIIAWDGKGGASNRKNLNPNYKAQREHATVIHWDLYEDKEEEKASLNAQAERLRDYLECLPVTFIQIDKLEADDIIAYLANSAGQHGHRVTIVSMDKDFLQLVTDNVQVYSPVKKVIYNYEETVNFLGILPENYNIVKALVGDDSDNLSGIKGLGFKTIIKLFPKLTEDPECTLQYVYDVCAENLGQKKAYANILNQWDKVELNFQIMNLQETVLDDREKSMIRTRVKAPVNKLRTGPFTMLLEQDLIEGITSDTEGWLMQFNSLQNY